MKGGTKTFFIGVLGAFPLILINYLFPVAIFYLPLPYYKDWDSDYFVLVAYKMNSWYERLLSFRSSYGMMTLISILLPFSLSCENYLIALQSREVIY